MNWREVALVSIAIGACIGLACSMGYFVWKSINAVDENVEQCNMTGGAMVRTMDNRMVCIPLSQQDRKED